MPILRHRLGKTFFIKEGRGPGLPFVFLHGGPGGTHKLGKALLKLGRDRPVYIYDQLGGGKSGPTPRSKWNVETLVEELSLLRQAWGLEEFHLGGGSWGTTLALEYYLRKKGGGVRSLFLSSPLFSSRDWKRDADVLIAKLPPKTRRVIEVCHEVGATDSKVYQDAMREYYLRHVMRDAKKLDAFIAESNKTNPHGGQVYEYMWGPSEFAPTGTLKTYDRVKDLKRVRVPTLIACGEHDEARPETARRYVRMMPNARFVELKGCSHVSIVEDPGAYLNTARDFLREQD